MANQVHLISAASLLNEDYRRDLRSTGRLRPMANDNDFIWQQMPLKYFGALVGFRRLNLRAYGEYSDYDEMKFPLFRSPLKDRKKYGFRWWAMKTSKKIGTYYNCFEHKLYISCWYSSPDLSDVGFKSYAHNTSGIAIGTTVKQLREVLQNVKVADKKPPHISRIVCGNIQYVPQRDIQKTVIFDPTQTYAPVFVKGSQFQMDREFRVCLELSEARKYIFNSEENIRIRESKSKHAIDEIRLLNHIPGLHPYTVSQNLAAIIKGAEWPADYDKRHIDLTCDPKSLIQRIALKDDGVFHKMPPACVEAALSKLFGSKVVEDKPKTRKNGFQIYKFI